MKSPRHLTAAERAAAAARRQRRRLGAPPAPPAREPRPSPPCLDEHDPALSPRACVEAAQLAVVTCHWNFAGYRSPERNLLRFLREMDEDGVPVYGLEMHLPGVEPILRGNPRWQCVELDPDRQMLWQKEAAINRAALAVPDHIRCLAAVDADLRFADPNWAARTVSALEETPVAQPYSEAVWVDESGRVDLRRACCARDGLDESWRTHPGFAWAFRREVFEAGVGFYPWCVTGAGDTASATGYLGLEPGPTALAAFGARNLRPGGHGLAWLEAVRAIMDGRRPGWVEGRVWHEWHGSRADRRYVERHALNRHVEVGRHVELGADGLLRWTRAATRAMRAGVAGYFNQRKEDG